MARHPSPQRISCGQASGSSNQPRWNESSIVTWLGAVVGTTTGVAVVTTGLSEPLTGGGAAVVGGTVVVGAAVTIGDDAPRSMAALTMMRFLAEYFGSHDVSVSRSSGVLSSTLMSDG